MATATTVNIVSSVDSAVEPSMYYKPSSSVGRPLVVSCHSWNGRYNAYDFYQATLDACANRGWGFISPDFRGAANSATYQTLHAGSDTAIEDVLDARNWALSDGGFSSDNVYILGGSGGGYMAMMVAAKNPTLFKAMGSVVGISDLARWHEYCSTRYAYNTANGLNIYSNSLEAIFDGLPSDTDGTPDQNGVYRDRSPITWLDALDEMPVHLQHGASDTTVQIENTIMAWNRIVAIKGYSGALLDGWEAGELIRAGRDGTALDAAMTVTGYPAGSYDYAVRMDRWAGNARLIIEGAGHTGDVRRVFDTFDLCQAGTVVAQSPKVARTPSDFGQPVS